MTMIYINDNDNSFKTQHKCHYTSLTETISHFKHIKKLT